MELSECTVTGTKWWSSSKQIEDYLVQSGNTAPWLFPSAIYVKEKTENVDGESEFWLRFSKIEDVGIEDWELNNKM